MSEQRYTYATVGISEEREEPVVVTGKRKASFDIGGEEFERTANAPTPRKDEFLGVQSMEIGGGD